MSTAPAGTRRRQPITPHGLQKMYEWPGTDEVCSVSDCTGRAAYVVGLVDYYEDLGRWAEQDKFTPFLCRRHRERNGLDGRYTNVCLARGMSVFLPIEDFQRRVVERAGTRSSRAWPTVRVTCFSPMFDHMLRDELPKIARRHVLDDGAVAYDLKVRRPPMVGPITWAQGSILVGYIELLEEEADVRK